MPKGQLTYILDQGTMGGTTIFQAGLQTPDHLHKYIPTQYS